MTTLYPSNLPHALEADAIDPSTSDLLQQLQQTMHADIPLTGAIGIREPAPDARGTWLHIVDRWQHLGTARDETEVDGLLRLARDQAFDADSYRLIRRCLKTLRAKDIIVFDRFEEKKYVTTTP